MTQGNFHSCNTQVFWACKALLAGRTIRHITEIREVRGWRLGAIVHCPRHDCGWPIQAEYRGPQNVAHYSLKAEKDLTALRPPRSVSALGDIGDLE